jgi:hypothetical protein
LPECKSIAIIALLKSDRQAVLDEAAERAVADHGYNADEREYKEYHPEYVPEWEKSLRAAIRGETK